VLLTTAYFPPISWFAAAAKEFTFSTEGVNSSLVYLEACENYQKQSYRNRCKILTSNGIENLNVPIIHDSGTYRHLITDIQIDYSEPWVSRTKRAIASAYYSSPYFEYYKDDLFTLLELNYPTLWELNLNIIRFFMNKIGIYAQIVPTTEYTYKDSNIYGEDLRSIIHPKKQNTILESLELKKPYFQVFSQKYGFQYDLSIMDLLFCEGPDSISFLKKIQP
jgi:hypothetical protein